MVTHPFFPLPVPGSYALLLLTPCPGTVQANVEQSLHELKSAGAMAVVTLMTVPELEKNEVEGLSEQAKNGGLAWFHLPVKDEGVPEVEFAEAWPEASGQIHRYLSNGDSVAIHCKGGSGRTGLVAAQILMERGVPKENAMALIKTLRPNAFSHAAQIAYLDQLADRIAATAQSDI